MYAAASASVNRPRGLEGVVPRRGVSGHSGTIRMHISRTTAWRGRSVPRPSVAYDFERLMEDAKKVKCSACGEKIVEHMDD